MMNRRSTNRIWPLIALLAVNGVLFVAAWSVALSWQYGGLLGIAAAAAAGGFTWGQFLTIALRIAMHPRPSPRHWLWAVAFLVFGSVTFCGLELFLDPWIRESDRATFLGILLAKQIPALLSLTAVGILILVLLRLSIWPFRGFLGRWTAIEREQGPGRESRQYSLAEIFFVTAGVAAACWLGRSLFDASLSVPLVQGAALLLAALPTALFAAALSRQRAPWRNFVLACTWVVGMSLLLMQPVAVANESIDLLVQWTGWRPMNPWSVESLTAAAAFTGAVASATRLNWIALALLATRRDESTESQSLSSPARLTPPAAPR
jgi:hypothetical protein